MLSENLITTYDVHGISLECSESNILVDTTHNSTMDVTGPKSNY